MRPAPVQRFGLLLFGASFLALFATLAIAEGLGRPSVPGGDVALIEDAPGDGGHISEAELRATTRQVLAQGGQSSVVPGSELYEQAAKEALGRLIRAAWVEGEAAERDLTVSAAEVSAATASFKNAQRYESASDLKRFLEAQALSRAQFRDLIALRLLNEGIVRAATEVPPPSEAEVEDYYEAARAAQFTTAPQYDIRMILNFDRDKVARAKAQLQRDDSPATWKRLAKRYSEDPVAKNEGGLHPSIPAEFGEPLDAAIAEAHLGEVQGPLKTRDVYFVFQVESETPPETEPLAEARPNIENALGKRSREEALEAFAADFEAKWRSRTHCVESHVVEGCANYRGTGHPPNAPPACYEAQPQGGIAAPACPAPVAQLIPAMPGTVSLLAPKGVTLPQRPHPAEKP